MSSWAMPERLWTRSFALVWAFTFLTFFFALRAQS